MAGEPGGQKRGQHSSRSRHGSDAGPRDAQQERLRELLTPLIEDAGLYLEDVRISGPAASPTLAVVVDLPEQHTEALSLDAVADISREVSTALDDDPNAPAAAYQLEVTSPGAERPLTQPRHWRRSLRRLVKLTRTDGEKLLARITNVDDDGVHLLPRIEGVKGRKPKDGPAQYLTWDEIKKARVEVEFSGPELSLDEPVGEDDLEEERAAGADDGDVSDETGAAGRNLRETNEPEGRKEV